MSEAAEAVPAGPVTGRPEDVAQALLAWYDGARRELPWRAPPGTRPDPYAVWLSEVMLQQTTAKAVAARYGAFLSRWPSFAALAAASLDDVLTQWAGLGYYARARNLHACARAVATHHGGRLPETEAELARLPGIGAYTAAAIAAIAFDRPAAAVDANAERVLARLFAVETPLLAAKPQLRRLAEQLVPARRPGDFAQAMMDLGATVCTPRNPSCPTCPLGPSCVARRRGVAARLPYRRAKADRPTRHGTAYVVLRSDGALLLRRRLPSGLLGGMMEVPSSGWDDGSVAGVEAQDLAPPRTRWRRVPGRVRHTFTHFHLELEVRCASVGAGAATLPVGDWRWVPRRELQRTALPSLMRKVIAHALGTGD